MKSEKVEDRVKACLALGEMKSAAAIPHLIEALADEKVHTPAVPRGVPLQRTVWIEAGRALLAIGRPAAGPLAEALHHRLPIVRVRAGQVLMQMGDPRGRTALRTVARTDEADAKARWFALEVLARDQDVTAVPILIEKLKDPDSLWSAVWMLGRAGDPRATEPLVEALRQEAHWSTHQSILRALGEIGKAPKDAGPALAALDDKNPDVRRAAADALGRMADRRGVEPLIRALDDLEVRTTAAEALGRIEDPRALAPLERLLPREANEHNRLTIAAAIARIKKRANAPATQPADPFLALIRQAIAMKPREGGPRDAGAGWRTGLAFGPMLAATGQDKDLKALPEDRAKWEAAINDLGESEKVWALAALLDHENVSVKMWAARALGQLGQARAVPALLAAAKANEYLVTGSPHYLYRRTLKSALEKITALKLTPKGLKVTEYPQPGQGRVITSDEHPERFPAEVDFAKVEAWLTEKYISLPVTQPVPSLTDEWIEERRQALETELGAGWKITAKRKVSDGELGLGVHFFGGNETIRFDPPGPKGERYASVQLYLHPLPVKEPLAFTRTAGSLYSIVLGETDLHRAHGGFVIPDGTDREKLLSAVRRALGIHWSQTVNGLRMRVSLEGGRYDPDKPSVFIIELQNTLGKPLRVLKPGISWGLSRHCYDAEGRRNSRRIREMDIPSEYIAAAQITVPADRTVVIAPGETLRTTYTEKIAAEKNVASVRFDFATPANQPHLENYWHGALETECVLSRADAPATKPAPGGRMSQVEPMFAPRDLKVTVPKELPNELAKSDAFLATLRWHEYADTNNVRMTWFLHGGFNVAMICSVNLDTGRWMTSREVYDHAHQATKRGPLDSPAIASARKLIKKLPESAEEVDPKFAVLVSVPVGDERSVRVYSRRDLPEPVAELYKLVGAYIDTSDYDVWVPTEDYPHGLVEKAAKEKDGPRLPGTHLLSDVPAKVFTDGAGRYRVTWVKKDPLRDSWWYAWYEFKGTALTGSAVGGSPSKLKSPDIREAPGWVDTKPGDAPATSTSSPGARGSADAWGDPVRGIAARVVPSEAVFKLGEAPVVTFELKKVAEGAAVPKEIHLSQVGLAWLDGGGSMYQKQETVPVKPDEVGVGEVFWQRKLYLSDFGFTGWINADCQVRIGYQVHYASGGKAVFAHSRPVTIHIDLPDPAALDKHVKELAERLDEAKKAGTERSLPAHVLLGRWLVWIAAVPPNELKDKPHEFLRFLEGKDSLYYARQDAGYLYGRRVALKHLQAGRHQEYVPPEEWKDKPFILGFLRGYADTVAAAPSLLKPETLIALPATAPAGAKAGIALDPSSLKVGLYDDDKAKLGLYAIGLYDRSRFPPFNALYDRAASGKIAAGRQELIGRMEGAYSATDEFEVAEYVLDREKGGGRISAHIRCVRGQPQKAADGNYVWKRGYVWAALPQDLAPGTYRVTIQLVEYLRENRKLVVAPKTAIRAFEHLTCTFKVPAAATADTQPAGMTVRRRQEMLMKAVNVDPFDRAAARAALEDVGNVEVRFAKGPLPTRPEKDVVPKGVSVQNWDGKYYFGYSDGLNRTQRGPAPEAWLDKLAAARKDGYELRAVKLAVAPTDEIRAQRDRLLTEADAKIRNGLLELSKTFPQLRRTGLRTLAEQLTIKEPFVGRVGIWAVRGESPGKGNADLAPPGEGYGVTVAIGPLHFYERGEPRAQMVQMMLADYDNLALMGQVHYGASDPKLDAAVKKLIDDALAPLKALNRKAGQADGDAAPAAATRPAE